MGSSISLDMKIARANVCAEQINDDADAGEGGYNVLYKRSRGR